MIIGITGGIGSGKSTVCSILRKQGFPVYSCDVRAKMIMTGDPDVRAAIIELVGEDAYTEKGELCKKVIGDFIFGNEENRNKLNAIVHPKVKTDFTMWSAMQDSDIVFMENAILYESGFVNLVDKVIYIFASEEIRIHRVIRRDKLTRLEVNERMKAQLPEAVKMKLADFCIFNNGNDNIIQQLQKLEL